MQYIEVRVKFAYSSLKIIKICIIKKVTGKFLHDMRAYNY